MKKTRSDVVISVVANNGKNNRPSLLDADAKEEAALQRKCVAFGPDVVDNEAGDQPDCCDVMCPATSEMTIENVLCRADEALCVCSITDNFETLTGIQLCGDNDDIEDDEEEDEDDIVEKAKDAEDASTDGISELTTTAGGRRANTPVTDTDETADDEKLTDRRGAKVDVSQNSIVVSSVSDKPDSSSNTTCDETVSDAEEASVVVDDSSGIVSLSAKSKGIQVPGGERVALEKDVSKLTDPGEPKQAEQKEEEAIATNTNTEDEANDSVLVSTLTALGDMVRNPFPADVSPIKTEKSKSEPELQPASAQTTAKSTSDNAKDDNGDDTAVPAVPAAKAPVGMGRTSTTLSSAGEEMTLDNINLDAEDEVIEGQDNDEATDKAVPTDTTDNTANTTTDGPEENDNDNNNDLDITSDLQDLETDSAARRIKALLKDAYGEHCFSADELESKGQVLLERYAGREALLVAALEKKIQDRKKAQDAVENPQKTALGELDEVLTSKPEVKKKNTATKTRKTKKDKAKSLMKKFKLSPKKSKTAAC